MYLTSKGIYHVSKGDPTTAGGTTLQEQQLQGHAQSTIPHDAHRQEWIGGRQSPYHPWSSITTGDASKASTSLVAPPNWIQHSRPSRTTQGDELGQGENGRPSLRPICTHHTLRTSHPRHHGKNQGKHRETSQNQEAHQGQPPHHRRPLTHKRTQKPRRVGDRASFYYGQASRAVYHREYAFGK